MTPKLLTITEAAEVARRHRMTVWQWCHDGELRHQQRRPRGPIYIWESDLFEFLGADQGGSPDARPSRARARSGASAPAGWPA